jgi:hypothetical protein
MERERKKKFRVPVEVDDEHGFSIDEERLDESLHRRIDELADEKVTESKSSLRVTIASVLGLFFLGVVAVLAMRGAVLLAFILILAGMFNVGSVVNWIEGKNEEGS